MICLFQKVKSAEIVENNHSLNSISTGVLIYLGIESKDTDNSINKMIEKILTTEIIPDSKGRMTLTLDQTKEPVMVISQFTLCANLNSKKPSFSNAMTAAEAKICYRQFIDRLQQRLPQVISGNFGSYLQISSVNDGPVNFLLTA